MGPELLLVPRRSKICLQGRRFDNLHCAGRTGSFGYLHMDEALEEGFRAAEEILRAVPGKIRRPHAGTGCLDAARL